MIHLVFGGRPVPWARVQRGKGQSFTPEKQREHRKALAWALKAAAHGKTLEGQVAIKVSFNYEKDHTEVTIDRAYEVVGRTKRPDLDNLLKQVMEALEMSGIVKDDAQVVYVTASKV